MGELTAKRKSHKATGKDNLLFSRGILVKFLHMMMMRLEPLGVTDQSDSSKRVLKNLLFELTIYSQT
jgi:hypothetical protein